jgi:hypothetical protein
MKITKTKKIENKIVSDNNKKEFNDGFSKENYSSVDAYLDAKISRINTKGGKFFKSIREFFGKDKIIINAEKIGVDYLDPRFINLTRKVAREYGLNYREVEGKTKLIRNPRTNGIGGETLGLKYSELELIK